MNKNKIDDLDVVNPKDLNLEELQNLMVKTDEEVKNLYKQEEKLYKQIRGKLWIWWLLPIFGWIVYITLYNNRKNKPVWTEKLIRLKRQTAEKEIQVIFNKKRYDELTKK